jgi:hypothetical protein
MRVAHGAMPIGGPADAVVTALNIFVRRANQYYNPKY